MRRQDLPVGLQGHVCPIEIQFLMFGFQEFGGNRLSGWCVQGGANHHAVLNGEEVANNGMIVPGQCLFGSGAHAGVQFRLQFFRRERRQRLLADVSNEAGCPTHNSPHRHGGNNRDNVNQDGAPVETRHLP